MDFKKELSTLKEQIDAEIRTYLDSVIAEAEKTDVFVVSILKHFKKTILSGGKRIRPIMMYWGYVGAGGKDKKEIIKASISIELIHAFLLIHDDIVDRDDLRRGQKTIHAKYRDHYKKFFDGSDSVHFGNSIGIISGDFVYSLGNQVLFSSNFSPEIVMTALKKMQDIVGLTCVGEIQDIYMERTGRITEKAILKMYENKTARYTFDGPLKLGAMLAGATDEQCARLTDFAVPLGIAFQIRDDILGIYGDEKVIGKPVGSDIAEGKRTFIVNRAFKKAHSQQKKTLKQLLGKKDLTQKDVEDFRDLIKEIGVKDEVEKYMQELIDDAQEALEKINITPEAKAFLYDLTQYLNNREK
jgi:geranylgeranyl diphosphate synthase, type I